MNTMLAPGLLSRLERLAQARHVRPDSLLDQAVREYLDREEVAVTPRPRRTPGGDEGKVVLAPDSDAALPE